MNDELKVIKRTETREHTVYECPKCGEGCFASPGYQGTLFKLALPTMVYGIFYACWTEGCGWKSFEERPRV